MFLKNHRASIVAYSVVAALSLAAAMGLVRLTEEARGLKVLPFTELLVHSGALGFEVTSYLDALTFQSDGTLRETYRKRVMSRLSTVTGLVRAAARVQPLPEELSENLDRAIYQIQLFKTTNGQGTILQPRIAEMIKSDVSAAISTIHQVTGAVVARQATTIGLYALYSQILGGVLIVLAFIITGLTLRLQHRNRKLARIASEDPLTGLPVRRHMERLLQAAIAAARRNDQPLSFAIIDVDHFKQVNDRHGHPAGDQVLVAVGACLNDIRRPNDIVARLGGEEFVLAMPRTGMEAARCIAEELRVLISVKTPETGIAVTVSIGIATARGREARHENLYRWADCALYAAKHSGRNCVIALPAVEDDPVQPEAEAVLDTLLQAGAERKGRRHAGRAACLAPGHGGKIEPHR